MLHRPALHWFCALLHAFGCVVGSCLLLVCLDFTLCVWRECSCSPALLCVVFACESTLALPVHRVVKNTDHATVGGGSGTMSF